MATVPEKTAAEITSVPTPADRPAPGEIREDRWAALFLTLFGGLFVLILLLELLFSAMR